MGCADLLPAKRILPNDAKRLKLILIRGEADDDLSDHRLGGPQSAPGDQLFERVSWPFCHDLNRRVGKVLDPTGQPVTLGLFERRGTKEDALYSSDHNDPYACEILVSHPHRVPHNRFATRECVPRAGPSRGAPFDAAVGGGVALGIVKGFILAAGRGERLRPITDSVPKPLLPVGNLPLIGYALRLLKYNGIEDVIINLFHGGKVIREALGDGSDYGVHITYSEEEELLGTGGGLKRMHEQLSEETFVVVNSDALIDIDLRQAIAAHRRHGALATMVLREDPRQSEYGQIETDPSGRIRRILGHGECGDALKPYMFTGVHVMDPRFLDYIPPEINTCVNRYAYMKALDNDELLLGHVCSGYFADAGTKERYYEVHTDALSRRLRLAHADPLSGFAHEPKRDVAEVVRMGRDVELAPGVDIVPPVLLGDGVRLGEGARVGPYVLLQAGVHVGRDAHVHHSVVLEGTHIDPDETVGWQLLSRKARLDFDLTSDD